MPANRQLRLGIADRGEVAGEETAVAELLRGKAALRRHDERLEQPLADRVAEEEVARLGTNRKLGKQPRRIDAGSDHDGIGCELAAGGQPNSAVLLRRAFADLHVGQRSERLDDACGRSK